MPHPFFDVAQYPFQRQEASEFHRALWQSIAVPARIDLIYKQCGDNLPPLALGQAPDVIWKEALQALAAARLIRRLCEVLRSESGAALEDVIRVIEAARDLLDERVLAGDRIFVDRKNLRDELEKLCGPTASHGVLLVRGGPSSGKSWTKYFIEDLSRGLGARCVYLFEGLIGSVDDVLNQLFAALGNLAAKPTQVESEAAYYIRACLKLQEVADERQREVWVVVDDLGVGSEGPRLDLKIRQFFEQFALSMANPVFARWFRLILLDYPDGPVPTRWKDVWVEDRPTDADVDQAALVEFLEQWIARKRRQLPEAERLQLVADIIGKVDAAPTTGEVRPRLVRLHDTLSAALKRL